MSVAVLADPKIETPVPVARPNTVLSMQGVCKGFGSGVTRNEVLTNINLNVREGEFLAVVGFSGSGKSTFMKLLAGLEKPDSGDLLMNGQPIIGPDLSVAWCSRTTRFCLG